MRDENGQKSMNINTKHMKDMTAQKGTVTVSNRLKETSISKAIKNQMKKKQE